MRAYIFGRRRYFIAPLILIAFAVFSLVVMLLWNALMPVIFSLPTVTFWQAAGLLVLSKLLLGMGRPYSHWSHNYKKSNFSEKISKMTPEERKEFFKKMHVMRHSWRHHDCEETKSEQKEKTE